MAISTGRLGEQAAADFLCSKGYAVIEKNYHSRYGEIDIIARDSDYIVFVEVKTRPLNSLLLPREAVDAKKQSRLIKTALIYLSSHDIGSLQPRFDVIEVIISSKKEFHVEKINQIENAFIL
jgi:putative endonuclease